MSYWACAQLEPYRERLALHCLGINGFSRIPAPSSARRKDPASDTKPLFPGYAFVVITLGWWNARWSPGVARLVLDGAAPAKVPDHIIAGLRERKRNGVIELPKAPTSVLRAGDPVRVTHGPFAGFAGLYQGMRGRQRIEILLTVLGSQQRVTLPKGSVDLAPASSEL